MRSGTRSSPAFPRWRFSRTAFVQDLLLGAFEGDTVSYRRLQSDINAAIVACGHNDVPEFRLVHYKVILDKLQLAAPTFGQIAEVERTASAKVDSVAAPVAVPGPRPHKLVAPVAAMGKGRGKPSKAPRSLAGHVQRLAVTAAGAGKGKGAPVAHAAHGAPTAAAPAAAKAKARSRQELNQARDMRRRLSLIASLRQKVNEIRAELVTK